MTLADTDMDAYEGKFEQQLEEARAAGRAFLPVGYVKPKFEFADLVAEEDFSQQATAEDIAWLTSPPMGAEII